MSTEVGEFQTDAWKRFRIGLNELWAMEKRLSAEALKERRSIHQNEDAERDDAPKP